MSCSIRPNSNCSLSRTVLDRAHLNATTGTPPSGGRRACAHCFCRMNAAFRLPLSPTSRRYQDALPVTLFEKDLEEFRRGRNPQSQVGIFRIGWVRAHVPSPRNLIRLELPPAGIQFLNFPGTRRLQTSRANEFHNPPQLILVEPG